MNRVYFFPGPHCRIIMETVLNELLTRQFSDEFERLWGISEPVLP